MPMFPLSFPFHPNFNYPPIISESVLNIQKDTYEDYLAFLFENNDQLSSDNHLVYLQKHAFDAILDTFHDEELLILQEKEDMYMYYIMYSTLYNTGNLPHEEFLSTIAELSQFYSLTQDEILFVGQIQQIVKNTLVQQVSPFSYLEACKDLFSQKLHIKLIDILKFMMGDSLCYKMNPASILGLCLKWTVHKYGITNLIVNQLIGRLIDLQDPQISQKIEKLQKIMNEVMKTNETQ